MPRSTGAEPPSWSRSGPLSGSQAAHRRSDQVRFGAPTGMRSPFRLPPTSLSAGPRGPAKQPVSRLRRPVRNSGTRLPVQFPAGQGRVQTHMPARAAWRFSERKIRETESPRRPHPPLSSRCIGRKGDIGSRASASDFLEAGWRRGGAPGTRAGPLREGFHGVAVTRGLRKRAVRVGQQVNVILVAGVPTAYCSLQAE